MSHRFIKTTPPPKKNETCKSEIVLSSGCIGCLFINKFVSKIYWVGVILSTLFFFSLWWYARWVWVNSFPGLFLAPLNFKGKSPGNEVVVWSYFSETQSSQNTQGETKRAWYASKTDQKGVMRYLPYPNLAKWAWYCSHIRSVKWYINNSRHLARKYARIFVRGHYLFREANSFPGAKLEETCELRGTENVQKQISEHIFAPNGGYCLFYPSNLFRNARSFENCGIFSDIPEF